MNLRFNELAVERLATPAWKTVRAVGTLALSIALTFALKHGAANAQTIGVSPPAPAPSPTASPDGPSDPCITALAIVARPSVTTGACVVKRGDAVVETGYQNTIAGASTAQYPQATIRVGTTVPNLEVSVALPALFRSATASGLGDTAFGAKYEVGYSPRWLYGVNGVVTVPTGANAYSANGTGYTANIDLSYALTPGASLAGTLGYNSLSNGSDRYTSIVPSLIVSGMLSSSTALFGEVAQFSHAAGPVTPTRTQYLVGLQQSFANRFQVDVEAGRSPTASTGTYHYLGAGASFLF
jgi:hypothetical protein